MAIVHMMVGIPGSGKSTYSKVLNEKFGYPVVSTDVVRTLHPDWEESLIWPEVYRLCAEYLSNGQDIIYDATNITPKVRNRFCDEVNKIFKDYERIAYFFDVPVEVCIKRVDERNKIPGNLFLPTEVIASYGERIVKPKYEEGFIKIIDIESK